MAPEQIEGGDVSASADVFGLGVLLYEALVGKLPFDGKNPAQVLRRVLDGTFTPADRARPTVGAGLSQIVARALARDAADRYQSARAMAEALKEELAQLGFTDLRREIWAFLRDSAGYQAEYEPRLVAELCKRANAARVTKDFVGAAAAFNRALAFRPDDSELLRQVAQIARGERVRRALTTRLAGAARDRGGSGRGGRLRGLAPLAAGSKRHAPERRRATTERGRARPGAERPGHADRGSPARSRGARRRRPCAVPGTRPPVRRHRLPRRNLRPCAFWWTVPRMRRSRSTAKRLFGSGRPTSSRSARTPSSSCRRTKSAASPRRR